MYSRQALRPMRRPRRSRLMRAGWGSAGGVVCRRVAPPSRCGRLRPGRCRWTAVAACRRVGEGPPGTPCLWRRTGRPVNRCPRDGYAYVTGGVRLPECSSCSPVGLGSMSPLALAGRWWGTPLRCSADTKWSGERHACYSPEMARLVYSTSAGGLLPIGPWTRYRERSSLLVEGAQLDLCQVGRGVVHPRPGEQAAAGELVGQVGRHVAAVAAL